MGNGISKTYPAGILKPVATKQVRWGHEEIKMIPPRHDETVPLLNTHEVERRAAEIKRMPIVKRPIQQKESVSLPKPLPHPKWTKWQKLMRGRPEIFMGGMMATIVLSGFIGPFALIIPAALIVYGVSCCLYRKFGPQAETLVQAQQAAALLAKRYQNRANTMRATGNIAQAKAYEHIVKKLK